MRKSIKENENWQTKAPEVCCKKDSGGGGERGGILN